MSPKPTPIYVYRNGSWTVLSSRDLLPGDIFSIAYQYVSPTARTEESIVSQPSKPGDSIAVTKNDTNTTPSTIPALVSGNVDAVPETARSDIVPCDCLLLSGSAIVNEASLTGL
jgi:magnesium-transporting ATPase (P-type)